MEFYFYRANGDVNNYLISDGESIRFWCSYDEKSFTKTLYSSANQVVSKGNFKNIKKFKPLRLHQFEIYLVNEQAYVPVKFKMLPLTFYECVFKNDTYKFVFHLGKKISIFRNNKQIGYYVKDQKLKRFEDIYGMELVAEADVYEPLILLMCLHIYSDFNGEDTDGGNPAFNLVLPIKRFDKSWKPTN